MPDNFSKEFQLLRGKYIVSLSDRAKQIQELWSMLRYLKWSDHGVKALQQLAHQLAGSGETFGFPDISITAKTLEEYLIEHQNPAQPIGGKERSVIDEKIDALVQQLISTSQVNQPGKPQQAAPARKGHNKRVFIVDDDTALSALLAVYLRSAGFIVNAFESPADAIQQLHEQTPDIILMDLGFPAHGHVTGSTLGITAIHDIHQHLGAQLPIILISSRSDISARLQALRAGGAGYLTKPLDFVALVNSLLATIEQHEQTRRVMIVDDDALTTDYNAAILRNQGMEVLCVTQPMQSLQRAAHFKPDLVVLDMHMPEINGVELATLLRQENHFALLPIIFLTADHSEQLQQTIHALGVNALLTKPVDPGTFIDNCKQAMRDAQRLKGRIEHITRSADNYQVTRHYLFSAIEDELQRSPSAEQPTAVYYLGVDQLGELNERYGYTGIAELHEAFCQRLATVIGSQEQWSAVSNLVACVLVSPRAPDHHQQRAAQIIRALGREAYLLQGEKKSLSLSLGIFYLNADITGVNDALQKAETAYEAAQQSGGNCAMAYDPQGLNAGKILIPEAVVNSEATIDIADHLPIEQLALSYQPVIHLENKDINHYDVLVRWRRADGELISAAKFLHRIQDPRMLVELDRWILQTAVTAMAADSSTRESATLFLHLSAQTLQQKIFFSFAANLLRNTRLRGSRRIVFILEESWVAAQVEQAEALITALHNAQCGVCLSRAGESLDSAYLIAKLSFDYVRLSPSLTEKITSHAEQQTQITQLVDAAKIHKSRMIATQVEDAKNLTLLWQLGIHLFQGFFIQAPGNVFHKKEDITFTQKHNASKK